MATIASALSTLSTKMDGYLVRSVKMNPKRHHCKFCGKIISAKRRYCSDVCRQKKKEQNDIDRRLRGKKTNTELVILWRQRKKIKAIKYKGGKCIVCKYNKCVRALTFHHLDPEQKDFGISASGTSKSWEEVKKELDKCVLLCQNCHCEVHEGIIDLANYIG